MIRIDNVVYEEEANFIGTAHKQNLTKSSFVDTNLKFGTRPVSIKNNLFLCIFYNKLKS